MAIPSAGKITTKNDYSIKPVITVDKNSLNSYTAWTPPKVNPSRTDGMKRGLMAVMHQIIIAPAVNFLWLQEELKKHPIARGNVWLEGNLLHGLLIIYLLPTDGIISRLTYSTKPLEQIDVNFPSTPNSQLFRYKQTDLDETCQMIIDSWKTPERQLWQTTSQIAIGKNLSDGWRRPSVENQHCLFENMFRSLLAQLDLLADVLEDSNSRKDRSFAASMGRITNRLNQLIPE